MMCAFTFTSRFIHRCESRDCSSISPVLKSAAAISSTTPRPRRRPPSFRRYRWFTTSTRPSVADTRYLLEPILALHDRIRDAVVDACESQTSATLAAVDAEEASDTIYRIDRVSEEILIAG